MGALIGGGVATLLSLFVLSRAIVDNPMYRFAQNLLVGAALGYATAALVRSAIVPPAEAILFGRATLRQIGVAVAGLILGLLLALRFGRQRGSHLANYPLAVLFGVGAALALIGAVRGTLAPQLLATVRSSGQQLGAMGGGGAGLEQAGAALLALLTIITLLGFTYARPGGRDDGPTRPGVRRRRFSAADSLRVISRVCILFTFGVFFAATVTTYINALVGQVGMISSWLFTLLGL